MASMTRHAGAIPLATAPAARPRRTPFPRTWPFGPADILMVVAANALLVAGMWLVHGGLDRLSTPAGTVTAVGQVTALLGTYAALVGIVLAARVPWIDHVAGSDRLATWHRWTGLATFWLLMTHFAATTAGWAMSDGSSLLDELVSMLSTWDVLIAAVGLALIAIVAVTSLRAVRRRLQYETWYGLHLYAYLGVALAFLHQVTLGTDLVDDPVALAYWGALHGVAFGLLITYRVAAPIRLSMRHRPRVASVSPEAPGVVSLTLHGRDLDRLAVRAGQFFQVRFLRGGGWWRHHPFSISAAPDGHSLRLTIRDLGDDSHRMLTMPVGTPVFLEGPYGAFTTQRISRPRVVMLAGGIGITPLRAMLEELPPSPGAVTLLVRAGSPEEVVFGRELTDLARDRGFEVRFLVGHRGTPAMPVDPLAPEWLIRLVPDLPTADVFVCGSRSFTRHVLTSLRRLGVPSASIHAERFGY
jgi:predicted ferric reductase